MSGPRGLAGMLLALCLLAPAPGGADVDVHPHADNRPAGAPDGPEAEEMRDAAHPLVRGRLSGTAARERLADFGRAWEAARESGDSTIPVFDAYLDDLGTARIAAWFEARLPACHGELHNLGKVVSRRTGDAVTAMTVCGDACTYACIHGALKSHYAARVESGAADVARVQADLAALCRARPVVEGFYAGNCAHAAGHAFAILTGDVARAVALCDVFAAGELFFYCESGVFMQVMRPVGRDLDAEAGSDRARRMAARLDFCAGSSRHVSACLRFLLADFRRPDDFDRLGSACDTLAGRERLGCFNALGYLARPHVGERPEAMNAVCGRGRRLDRELCVSGVAFAKKDHAGADKIDRACRALAERDLAAVCLEQHGRHYYRPGNPVLARMLGASGAGG